MEDNHKPAAPNRPSLKANTNFNNYPLWKAKLRENCYKRVREDRNRLLWKMRLPTSQSFNDKDFIKSAFQDIVSDELKKFKDLPTNDSMKISAPAAEPNDILWEYDGLHDAYQGECEEMLLEMQRIFYQDLWSDATGKEVSPIETWEDEEDEYLAHAVYEHMQLNDQAHKQTWCPICKRGELQENCLFIYCSACELRLHKDDKVNLDALQDRLADAHAEHLNQGCKLIPKFRIETSFGLTALYIFCEECKMFEVVM